jgi:hypothetical protein
MNIFLEMATICSLSVKPTGACRLISHRISYSTIPPRSPIPRFNSGVKCGYPPARGRAVDPCAPGECIGTPTTAANGLCDWHCEYANGISTRCLPPHQAVSGSLVAHRTRYDSVRRTRVWKVLEWEPYAEPRLPRYVVGEGAGCPCPGLG